MYSFVPSAMVRKSRFPNQICWSSSSGMSIVHMWGVTFLRASSQIIMMAILTFQAARGVRGNCFPTINLAHTFNTSNNLITTFPYSRTIPKILQATLLNIILFVLRGFTSDDLHQVILDTLINNQPKSHFCILKFGFLILISNAY